MIGFVLRYLRRKQLCTIRELRVENARLRREAARDRLEIKALRQGNLELAERIHICSGLLAKNAERDRSKDREKAIVRGLIDHLRQCEAAAVAANSDDKVRLAEFYTDELVRIFPVIARETLHCLGDR